MNGNEKVSGSIFQLQHFSVNDGDGIRTTIFMSGCPLRCQWCANPESWSLKPQLAFFQEKCRHCGRCAAVCQKGDSQCTACGACVPVCATHAREVMGKSMSVKEIAAEIKRYMVFYRYSEGGITYSGGEPSTQINFLQAMVDTFYNMGIHQAIETCGYFDWEQASHIFEKLDFIFVDIKHMDRARHKQLTGCDNKKILENIKKLGRLKKEIVVRIPLIKNINDTAENIKQTAKFVQDNVPDVKTEILPYHDLGTYKYQALGMDKYKHIYTPPSATDVKRTKAAIESHCVKTVEYK